MRLIILGGGPHVLQSRQQTVHGFIAERELSELGGFPFEMETLWRKRARAALRRPRTPPRERVLLAPLKMELLNFEKYPNALSHFPPWRSARAQLSALAPNRHRLQIDSAVSYVIYSYYIDTSVLLGNIPCVKLIRIYIRDPSGIFSKSSLMRIWMTSFPLLHGLNGKRALEYNRKKITRRLEDMNFIFSWWKQHCFHHEKINLIPIFACNILYIFLAKYWFSFII